MIVTDWVRLKADEVRDELKTAGLWKTQAPAWVTDYEEKPLEDERDFVDWLQFIYLPNCIRSYETPQKKMIVPQAIKFFGEDVKKGRLLQLLIELDSLL
jgi:uncharacterized protein YqcC (DUF446 family)